MSDEPNIQGLGEGYQPKHDELTKGYRVTQPLNPDNVKIPPKNLGTAAVTPRSTDNTTAAPVTPGKP